MIAEFYWALPIIVVGYLAYAVANSQKLNRDMRKNQLLLDDQAEAAKKQMEESRRRLDESNERARLSAERQERALEIAEENLAIQHEVRDLLDRMVKSLERRI